MNIPIYADETPNFDCGKLEILVMDEADRILDMGFRETMEAILEHLPRHRQTLLFSATQTRSVGDLARLSLRNPEFISVSCGEGLTTDHFLFGVCVFRQACAASPHSRSL